MNSSTDEPQSEPHPARTPRSFVHWGWWLGGIVAGMLLALGLSLQGIWPGADRAPQDIEQIVKNVILDNPELIPQAIDRLQQKEVVKLLENNREAVEAPFAGAWTGAENGDVVLVEFFDFNCPYCRQSSADVARLLAEDDRLKVVYRDMPVLGPDSERFALVSLSAARQGRYAQFYQQVFSGQGALNEERLIQAVRKAGLNEAEVARDLQSKELIAEVEQNLALGRALGLTGTPSFIIGDQILAGAVGYDALKEAVAEARAAS